MTGRRLFRPRLAYSADRAGLPAAEEAAARTDRFRQVMLPHMDAAYSYARYLTRDASRAEDVVQDAFLRAFRSFDTWRGEGARAWLFAIVRNCFLATADEAHRHALDAAAEAHPADHQHPEAIVAARDEAALLRETIASLPPPFREALILRELEELSYKEIALLTNVPIGTVMSRLARARQMLAELLLPGGAAKAEARR